MKKAEKESLLKSFFVFFISLCFLSGLLFIVEYKKMTHDAEEKILSEMKLCSYDLKCPKFEIDFVQVDSKKMHELQKTNNEIFALFSIINNEKYALKLSLQIEKFENIKNEIKKEVLFKLAYTLFIIAIISLIFSLYALYPLKKALQLTEEFSRDILHDINTPLASIRLNTEMLKAEEPNNRKLERISKSADAIAILGDSLKSYLEQHENSGEIIEIKSILQEQIQNYKKLFPNLIYTLQGDNFQIFAYKDTLYRIFDNLLSNASKYNKENGLVNVYIFGKNKVIKIEDTGKGLQNPKKVFDRYYKEDERGMGIGLHIVKKFCDEIKVIINITTSQNGTIFSLDFSKLNKKGLK